MPEIKVPVLLDYFDEIDVIQALKEIEALKKGQALTLCQSSAETDLASVVVKSSLGITIGRITPTRLDRIKSVYRASVLLSALFDQALIFGCQITLVLEEGSSQDAAILT